MTRAGAERHWRLSLISKVQSRMSKVQTPESKVPRISPAEWEVMRTVWGMAPCLSRQVAEALEENGQSWRPVTVRTMLGRLVRKRALGYTQRDGEYLYRPLVGKEECLDAACESFVEQYFEGSIERMAAHFLRRIARLPGGKGTKPDSAGRVGDEKATIRAGGVSGGPYRPLSPRNIPGVAGRGDGLGGRRRKQKAEVEGAATGEPLGELLSRIRRRTRGPRLRLLSASCASE